ncbi:MAG: hypothetical protein WAW36_19075 [Methylovulum miyakonense]|uniref:hypothetical protein n=1 Tax=Methylovulum miyakonense TaxID=645578 RepID=UPI003BB6B396
MSDIPQSANFDSFVTIKTWAKTSKGYEYEVDILTDMGTQRISGSKPTIDEAYQEIQQIIKAIYCR